MRASPPSPRSPSLSRRHLLAAAAVPAAAWSLEARPAGAAPAGPRSPLNGPVGLELYSLRHLLETDVSGTLAKVRKLGFVEVEVPALYGKTADEFAALLKRHGLRAQSYITGFERFDRKLDEVIAETKALGATYVVCPGIPRKGKLSAEDVKKVIDLFPRWGEELKGAGLRFAYHIHGFEFEPSPDGTLMDTMIKGTPADLVDFELDVFWVRRGGCDPVRLLNDHPGRFPLLHLKDIEKGLEICKPNGGAPDETSVVLGQGMINWPKVLKAAITKGGARLYYVEDEHPDAEKQIPLSLRYLAGLKL
jgi:sugar phosphate isomerase/epimerase